MGTLSMQLLPRQCAVVLECSFCCCCAQYTVRLSTGTVNTTKTSVTVPIGVETTATVYCVDNDEKMVTKTEEITINTSKQ